MKSRIRIMGRLSVVLLICVLLGQGAWMYRVREMKVDEFRKTADYVLQDIIQIFLDNQAPFAIKKLKLGYSCKHSNKCTFYTLRFGCSFAAVNTIKPQLL